MYIFTRIQLAVMDFEFSTGENAVFSLKPIVKDGQLLVRRSFLQMAFLCSYAIYIHISYQTKGNNSIQ